MRPAAAPIAASRRGWHRQRRRSQLDFTEASFPPDSNKIERVRTTTTLVLVLALLTAWALSQAPAPSKPKSNAKTEVCGPISDGLLRCPRFGFTYKIIFGWVDRTDEMQQDPENGPDAGKSQTLLAVFERPPGAPGDTINSAVVIAAEDLADYHGIKQASDYFGPTTELAENRGFKIVNEPYSFSVGAKQLVRGDFSKERGKLTMWQSSLVMIEKGYIVSFTFVGGSEDEVEELIENLSFATKAQPHK